jgi:uncharacterized protein
MEIGSRFEPAFQKALDRIRKVLSETSADIYLFGSQARGDARPDSDYDLMIVFHEPLSRDQQRQYRYRIKKELFAHGEAVPMDILSRNQFDFEQEAQIGFSLLHQIREEGVRL